MNHRIAVMLRFLCFWGKSDRVRGVWVCRSLGTQELRNSGTQELRNSGTQESGGNHAAVTGFWKKKSQIEREMQF